MCGKLWFPWVQVVLGDANSQKPWLDTAWSAWQLLGLLATDPDRGHLLHLTWPIRQAGGGIAGVLLTGFSYVLSWFMGRRPEYTDPKVVAQGEGREGKTDTPNPS